MKSELSFLLELILDDETPKPIKAKLVRRVQDVEKNYAIEPSIQRVPRGIITPSQAPIIAAQSPSMQRLMADNPDLIPRPPQPVTAEAAKALADRAALLHGAVNGDNDKGRKSARKF